MADIQRTFVNDESFIRGAARILWAGSTVSFPTKIADVINMSLYDAQTGWNELGATKTGIQISVNNAEENFDVDQILGDLQTLPTNWEVSVQTALAETTLDRLSLAWEGYPVAVDSTPTSGAEKVTYIGAPVTYTERRLAVLFQRPSGKIRGFFFRKANRAPQESAITFNKTGEQQTIPVRFTVLQDLSVAEPKQRFFMIRDQQ